jgi:deoxyuridine 5'-triphosphate nucleotidohydrolase
MLKILVVNCDILLNYLSMKGNIMTTTITPMIYFKRSMDHVKLPTYGTQSAACFDFYSSNQDFAYSLQPGETFPMNTQLVPIIPAGHSLRLHARSGLANGEGIIDEDYRQNIIIALKNTSQVPFVIEPFMRIAQGELVKDARAAIYEYIGDVSQVGDRIGGLGSTGLK